VDLWLEDLEQLAPPAPEDGLGLVCWAADHLRGKRRSGAPLSPVLRSERGPRVVFLSASDGTAPARLAVGAGRGMLAAVRQAVARLPEGSQPAWVKLDLVQAAWPADRRPGSAAAGHCGVAFPRPLGVAFLPEEVMAARLLDEHGQLHPVRAAACWCRRSGAAQAPSFPSGPALHFAALGYLWEEGQAYRLARGHRVVEDLAPESLLAAARLGGQYLVRAAQPDGRFGYLYQPETDTYPEGYNLVRHAGTSYALLELYQATGEKAFAEVAGRALDFLQTAVAASTLAGERVLAIQEQGAVKLGGVALAALALAKQAEATGEERHLPLLGELGRAMLLLQQPSGELVHKALPDGQPVDLRSDYYSGEALFALARMHALDGRPEWLEAAERGMDYLVRTQQESSDDELARYHWVLYALNELHRRRPRPHYLPHALRIARALVGQQCRDPRRPGALGSFGNLTSTTAAVSTEGLGAAYRLAQRCGEYQEAQTMLAVIRLGVRFQLQAQYLPELAMHLPRPQQALGGFRHSAASGEVRIDYVQHEISSLLSLAAILASAAG